MKNTSHRHLGPSNMERDERSSTHVTSTGAAMKKYINPKKGFESYSFTSMKERIWN